MKIKHFQGYGSVEATKVSKKTKKNEWDEKETTLTILVKGNHEWGLEMSYPTDYDVYNWLVKRFDKTLTDYRNIKSIKTHSYYIKENGLDVECCEYVIVY